MKNKMKIILILCLTSFVYSFTYSNTLVYSTYLGGYDEDYGYGIALDSVGNAYATGYTFSPPQITTSFFLSTK